MQRIKIPGGFLTSDQLVRIADASERYGSGLMHFTTREDAQIYYVQLEQVPELLRFLAERWNHFQRGLWKHGMQHNGVLSRRYLRH